MKKQVRKLLGIMKVCRLVLSTLVVVVRRSLSSNILMVQILYHGAFISP